jgi:Rrf2 family protein
MISNRCYYALKAMLELAIREGSGPTPISDVAAQQDIPARFLEAILRQLKQAGLTASARGKDGGYYLAKPARTITLGTVIRLFEGPLVGETGSNPTSSRNGPRGFTKEDAFADVWQKAEDALSTVYDGVTFGELAEKEKIRKTGGVADYAI